MRFGRNFVVVAEQATSFFWVIPERLGDRSLATVWPVSGQFWSSKKFLAVKVFLRGGREFCVCLLAC